MTITKNDLLNIYISNYKNVCAIKKYAKPNIESIRNMFNALNDKYVYFVYNLIKSQHITFSKNICRNYIKFKLNEERDSLLFDLISNEEPSSFFHELGHIADFAISKNKNLNDYSYSYYHKGLSIQMSLEIELEEKQNLILENLLYEQEEMIKKSFGEEFCHSLRRDRDLLVKYEKLTRKYGLPNSIFKTTKKISAKADIENQKRILSTLIKRKSFIRDEIFKHSENNQFFNDEHSISIDALSSLFDLSPYHLYGHNINYYKTENRLGEEFFANMFSATLTDNKAQLASAEKYLPESSHTFHKIFRSVCSEFRNVNATTFSPSFSSEVQP